MGNLAASSDGTSSLRLLLEGSRTFAFGAHRVLTPTLEVGGRRVGAQRARRSWRATLAGILGPGPQQVLVFTHPVAVAADVDDVAVVQQPVDERCGHDLVAEHAAPFLEALVGRQHRRRALVAGVDQLEEQHRAVAAHRQVADLVDHQDGAMGEHLEQARQAAGRLRLGERGDEVRERAVVHPAAGLRGGEAGANTEDRPVDRASTRETLGRNNGRVPLSDPARRWRSGHPERGCAVRFRAAALTSSLGYCDRRVVNLADAAVVVLVDGPADRHRECGHPSSGLECVARVRYAIPSRRC